MNLRHTANYEMSTDIHTDCPYYITFKSAAVLRMLGLFLLPLYHFRLITVSLFIRIANVS